MVDVLYPLKHEKEKYEQARNALINAKNSADNITGKLKETILNIEEGIDIGGTGLQLYRLSEMEGYVEYLKNNLSSVVSFCDGEITRLENEISERRSYLSSYYSFKGNLPDKSTSSKKYEPVQLFEE